MRLLWLLRRLRQLEKQVLSLSAELVAERKRNRQREEALIDRILTVQQQPALPKIALETDLEPKEKPRRSLTPFEEMTRENYAMWAEEAGKSKQDGYRRYDREHTT